MERKVKVIKRREPKEVKDKLDELLEKRKAKEMRKGDQRASESAVRATS